MSIDSGVGARFIVKQRGNKTARGACSRGSVIETETAFFLSPPQPLPATSTLFAIELHSPESRRLDHPHLDGQAASARNEALPERTRTTGVLKDRVIAGPRHHVLAVAGQERGVARWTGRERMSGFCRSVRVSLVLLFAVQSRGLDVRKGSRLSFKINK